MIDDAVMVIGNWDLGLEIGDGDVKSDDAGRSNFWVTPSYIHSLTNMFVGFIDIHNHFCKSQSYL